jgi:uncharacterized DUF497 family protein
VDRNDPLAGCTGFDWDDGNLDKNWQAHGVAFWEAEDVFFNEPLLVRTDTQHSASEARYLALGQTNGGRLLFVSFTVRGPLLRVISVRDMTRREVIAYARSKA